MDTKHTKGPWEIDKVRPGMDLVNIVQGNSSRTASNVIAFDVLEHNARLIAAAPDLLEALREIHNIAATPCLPENVSEDWPTVLMRRLGEIRHVSQKAVAKAGGR